MCIGLWEYIVTEINNVPRIGYVLLLALFLIGSVVFLVWNRKKALRNISGLFLGEYLFFIYSLTVIFRQAHLKASHIFTPFWSYNRLLHGGASLLLNEVIMNVVLFIPVGLLLGLLVGKGPKKKQWLMTVLVGMAISLGIEVLQFVFKKGSFEIDDIIHNTLGCLIGFAICKGCAKLIVAIKSHNGNN